MKRSELKADPDKVRAWIQRTRYPLKRSPRKRREKIPPGIRKRAAARSRYRCICCKRKATQLHHVLPVRLFPALSREEANLVAVCTECHAFHESAARRIRWQQLPECAITLAHTTSGAAVVFLERNYSR